MKDFSNWHGHVAILLEVLGDGGEVSSLHSPVGVEVIQAGGIRSPPGEEGNSARGTHCLLLGSRSRGKHHQRKTVWELKCNQATYQVLSKQLGSWVMQISKPTSGILVSPSHQNVSQERGREGLSPSNQQMIMSFYTTVSHRCNEQARVLGVPSIMRWRSATMASWLALTQS